MNAFEIIVVVFPAVMIVGAILAPALVRRRLPRSRIERLGERGGAAHVRSSTQPMAVQVGETGIEQESKEEFGPGADNRDQYLTDWTALQEKFCG